MMSDPAARAGPATSAARSASETRHKTRADRRTDVGAHGDLLKETESRHRYYTRSALGVQAAAREPSGRDSRGVRLEELLDGVEERLRALEGRDAAAQLPPFGRPCVYHP